MHSRGIKFTFVYNKKIDSQTFAYEVISVAVSRVRVSKNETFLAPKNTLPNSFPELAGLMWRWMDASDGWRGGG